MILEEAFYNTVLLEPASEQTDELCIVSGYATAAMANKNLENLLEVRNGV